MAKQDKPPQLTFNYIKSTQFRVIHVDGAFGGVAPRGHIHMSVYSERVAIPRVIVHQIDKDGKLGKEIIGKRESREGVEREMEVDLVFGLEEAKALHDWLTTQIEQLEKHKLKQDKTT